MLGGVLAWCADRFGGICAWATSSIHAQVCQCCARKPGVTVADASTASPLVAQGFILCHGDDHFAAAGYFLAAASFGAQLADFGIAMYGNVFTVQPCAACKMNEW